MNACTLAGAGARTAWGATLRRAAAGWRARLGAWELIQLGGRVRRIARVRAAPRRIHGLDRVIELGGDALREAAVAAPPEPLPLLLTVSIPSPGPEPTKLAPEEARRLLDELAAASGARIDKAHSAMLLGEAGAAFVMLHRAIELLHRPGGASAVYVGGIHTPLFGPPEPPGRPDDADPREATQRAAHRLEGEGAGFLLLRARGEGDRLLGAHPVVFDADAIAADFERRRLAHVPGEPYPEPDNPWADAWKGMGCPPPARVIADADDASESSRALRRSLRGDGVAATIDVDFTDDIGRLGGATPFVMAALARGAATLERADATRIGLAAGGASARGGVLVLELVDRTPDVEATQDRVPAPSPAGPIASATRAELFALAAQAHEMSRRPSVWSEEDAPPAAGLAPALDAADAALRRLSDSDLWDDAHLARIDDATAALRALHAAIPDRAAMTRPGFEDDADAQHLEVLGVLAEAGADALAAVRTRCAEKASALDVLRGAVPTSPREAGARVVRPIEAVIGPSHPPCAAVRGEAAYADDTEADGAKRGARQVAEAALCLVDVVRLVETARLTHGAGPAAPPAPSTMSLAPLDMVRIDERDRLLDRALVALGTLAERSLGEDGPPPVDVVEVIDETTHHTAPDPTRAFATAFILGSLAHPEGAFRAGALLDRAQPVVWSGIADGLALAASPAVGRELDLRIAREHDPDKLVALLSAAAVRRSAEVGVVAPHLASREPRVRSAAARALSGAADRNQAAALLLVASSREGDPGALAAHLEGALRLGAAHALVQARFVVDERTHAAGPFLRLLALAGRPEDVERLATSEPDVTNVRMWGWHGSPDLLDPLVEVLATEARRYRSETGIHSELSRTAAMALQRITGGGRADGPRRIAVQDRLTTGRSDLEIDPAPWRDHLRRTSLGGRQRYRFGRAYDLAAPLAELEAKGADHAERRDAALEIAIRSGGVVRLRDVLDRAALQRPLIRIARGG